MIKKIMQFLNITSKVLKWCCVAIAALLILSVGIQVSARYVLGKPTSWSEALSQIMFIWLTLFGTVITVREKTSLWVDVVQNRLKGKYLVICKLLCDVIGMIVVGFFIYSSILQITNTMHIMEGGLPISRGAVYIGILIAFIFMFLSQLEDMMELIKQIKNKEYILKEPIEKGGTT